MWTLHCRYGVAAMHEAVWLGMSTAREPYCCGRMLVPVRHRCVACAGTCREYMSVRVQYSRLLRPAAALQALNETLQVAQQNRDPWCLVHALAALCRTMAASALSTTSDAGPGSSSHAKMVELARLLRRCQASGADMGCPHLVAYARVALARFSLLHSLQPADSQPAPELEGPDGGSQGGSQGGSISSAVEVCASAPGSVLVWTVAVCRVAWLLLSQARLACPALPKAALLPEAAWSDALGAAWCQCVHMYPPAAAQQQSLSQGHG